MQTNSNEIGVFTHGKLTRSFAFLISGVAIFFYTRQCIIAKSIMENLTAKMLLYPQSANFYYAMKLLTSLSLVAGLVVVLIIFYTLIDVWGLKVIITTDELIVINTLIKKFPGTGRIPCDEIVEIKKGLFRFKILGEKNSVSISGVEKIDLLFHLIYECKNNKFKDKLKL
ncbi:hypothetical protein TTHT_0661 [Thermotomaculum hydrothermale]|uniref:Uncharacterized protein n=1 Tax=Thermotomaculum hydrothermale TaxID=981385 RepID=A0A7R6SY65_9BACT|nr:hypothetical protein [Thermotomaculum hydrothermale]BBB32236.1 hypothetical protein TTHT_0661 [Thermotomaculum hydrothermale]